ncbi:MAG: DUF4231 domain-containing protein [Desulfobacterales bacterium]|nr:MAG: DUF4231 domain-containing protein [Desulfobacterales bacterium]
MDEKEYLEQRLEDQIGWYDQKSQWNQKYYKSLTIIQMGSGVAIPFFTSFIAASNPLLKIIVGLLGLTVAIISGLLNIYKFQENWIQYRTTAESLKHEKYLYLTRSDPYHSENAFQMFVLRVEDLISQEHSKWTEKQMKPAGEIKRPE